MIKSTLDDDSDDRINEPIIDLHAIVQSRALQA